MTRREMGGWLAGGAASALLPLSSPQIVYEGRVAVLDDGRVRAGFPGVVMHLSWSGPRLSLDTGGTSETVYLDIVVDGGAPRTVRLPQGQGEIEVFSGTGGAHRAEIRRRGEHWQGQWDVFAVRAPGGKLLTPAPLSPRRLMFIGDSITCGEATDVARDETRNDIAFANANLSYGKVLARRLKAQCHLVSAGGRGLIRDWQGIADDSVAPVFYERALMDRLARWDHGRYVPDAIGICLGSNDFNTGIPDQHLFVSAMTTFVQTLRRDAPEAGIVLIDSPMLTDEGLPKRSVLRAYLDRAAAQVNDARVFRASLSHYPGRPVNAHPIAAEHEAMADELAPVFARLLTQQIMSSPH